MRYVLLGAVLCLGLGSYLVVTRPVDQAAPGQVTLRFGFPSDVRSLSMYARIVRRFAERNRDIHVVLEPVLGDFRRVMQRDLVADIAPDVFMSDDDDFTVFADAGHHLDLGPFLRADGFDLDVYYRPAYESFRWKGRQYGLPSVWGCSLILYNKDLLAGAGVTADPLTWTWDEFTEALRRLTRTVTREGRQVQQYGYIRDNQTHTVCHIWQAGGTILQRVLECPCGQKHEAEDIAEAADLRCAGCGRTLADAREYWIGKMDTPEALAGVRFAVGLMQYAPRQQANNTSEQSMNRELFATGRLAMMRGGPFSVAQLKDLNVNWDIGYYPAGPGGRWTRFYCDGFAIWSKTPHPREAWRLLKFVTGPEAQRVLAKEGLSIPARRAIAESVDYNRPDTPWDEMKFVRAIDHVRFQRKTPQFDTVMQDVSRWHDLVMLPADASARISPAEFCRRSQQEINRDLARASR